MQEELRDIHLPDPVSWWPPAPGWYIVLIFIIATAILLWFFISRLCHASIKKLALIELNNIENTFRQHGDNQKLCSDISILLRRVAISHGSREQFASSTGQDWIQQLNTLCGQQLFDEQLATCLLIAPYRPHDELPADKLLNTCKQWIRLLPRKPSHVTV